jgi:glycerol kinase
MIFDHTSSVIAWEYEEHEQIYPKPGWVEHNAMEIWEKSQRVIKAAIKKAKIDPKEIAAIGVTNQRETTIVWDPKTGKPVYNAIVWQDTRTRDRVAELREKGLEKSLINPTTGLTAATYFSSTKIEWILKNVAGALEKAKRGELIFGNIDTWVIWNLTRNGKDVLTPDKGGAHVTDYSNASRTMLMDLNTLNWSSEMLNLFGVPKESAPMIRPSSDKRVYGYTPADGPFGAEIPVCGDLGDQQAALVGQAAYSIGEAKNTYGTGCFMLLNIGSKPTLSKSGLLTTAAYGFEEGKCIYALEGSIAITGAAIQWLRDNLKIITKAGDTEGIAESVANVGSGGVFFVPAFSGLFAPYWDYDARGVITGLTRFINKDHLVHATLESICWQTKDVFEAMYADTGTKLAQLKVDGGAVPNNYLMQLQSEILGADVVRPKVTETTALGSAYAAGMAVGFWKGTDELRKLWNVDRVFKPTWDDGKRVKLYKGWKAAVARAQGWLKETGELPPSGVTEVK